jgi:hypothetical protein
VDAEGEDDEDVPVAVFAGEPVVLSPPLELNPKRNMLSLFPPPHVSLEFPCP